MNKVLMTFFLVVMFSYRSYGNSFFTPSTFGLGFGIRYEDSADNKFTNKFSDFSVFFVKPLSYVNWSWQIDLRHVSKKSNEGNFNVELDRVEIDGWLIYDLSSHWRTHWLLGAGFGVYKDQVKMILNNIDSSVSEGDLGMQMAISAGVFWNLFEKCHIRINLENYWPIERNERTEELATKLMLGYNFQ